jgi:hypoxanthine phosphoribosyltransferase
MNEVATQYPGIQRVVFSEDEIASRVRELGREIDAYYGPGDELLVIGLLKGAFMFASDLVRAIERPALKIDFVVASLYGKGTDASGEVQLVYDVQTEIEGRHLLVIEDVVDSGKTLSRVCDRLLRRSPRSLEVCALLHKHLARDLRYEPRWVGFSAPPDWLVGYGLDLGERYRHLPFVGALASEYERGL